MTHLKHMWLFTVAVMFTTFGNFAPALSQPSPLPAPTPQPPQASFFSLGRTFPTNYTIYGVNIRSHEAPAVAGNGLFYTCDSGEVAIGAFCEEKANQDSEPNALLTAGVATTRSVACRWKNNGLYKVVASCLAIQALKGDPKFGTYVQNGHLD